MLALCMLGLATLPSRSSGQDWARERLEQSPRHLEWVNVTHGDRQVKCFVAFPEVSEKATAVLVIHEIFGLTDWVRGVADQLAEAGYIAIAPDLLSGTGPDGGATDSFAGGDAVRQAIASLPPEQVTADLNAAAQYVAQLPASNGKVVVAGFCWGGRESFRFSTNNDKIAAAFVFYGQGPENAEQIAKISAPVYGFYGENDERINATVPATVRQMEAAGKKFEPVEYEGAGHGFMRSGEAPDAMPANRQARQQAWQRWKTLLSEL
jgi:carboxymethylenebutenolidase